MTAKRRGDSQGSAQPRLREKVTEERPMVLKAHVTVEVGRRARIAAAMANMSCETWLRELVIKATDSLPDAVKQ